MRLNRINVVLTALLAGVVMLCLGTQVDYTQPNFEILPDMKYTPAWTAYASNPIFVNGRTLQAPVHGTIARGQTPLHFEATKEEAIRAGEEISNPYQITEPLSKKLGAAEAAKLQESIRRGSDTYRVFCVCCHGATGKGDGTVTTRGFPPPPSLLTGKSRQMKDGQLFHVLTYGQTSMPDFRGQLSTNQRWDAINYIRSLQSKAPLDKKGDSPVNSRDPQSPLEDDSQAAAGSVGNKTLEATPETTPEDNKNLDPK